MRGYVGVAGGAMRDLVGVEKAFPVEVVVAGQFNIVGDGGGVLLVVFVVGVVESVNERVVAFGAGGGSHDGQRLWGFYLDAVSFSMMFKKQHSVKQQIYSHAQASLVQTPHNF